MRFRNVLLPVACFAVMILALAGCTSSHSAPPPPPVSIAFMGTPPSSVQAGGFAPLTAVVSNDPSNAGVDWSLTCVGDCGSFTAHTASGDVMTFEAPLTVPSSNAVTVIASAAADHTKSVSATITITPQPIQVFFNTVPPADMATNATVTVEAEASNDSTNAGVDWSVTCGSAACGSFGTTHTATGSSTAYTAPSAVPAGNIVTIIATSTADSTVFASTTINISSPADLAKLNGTYVFEVSGEDENSSPYTIAGQLTADGAGNITGGEDDFSDFYFSLPNTITGGTYSMGPDGRGTIAIDDNRGQETFSIVLVSGSHILMTEFDFGGTSTGTMDRQTVPSGGFSTATLSGGYAFAMSGIDPGTFLVSWGGVMNVDSPGGISGTGSVADINGAVISTSQPLSGSVLSVDSLGRADILLNVGNFSGVELIAYIADPAHLKVVEIDNVLGRTGGTAIGQGLNTGTFTSNTTFSGNFVFSALGISAPFDSTAAAGLFTADGAGNITNGTLDINAAGLPENGNFTGSYTLDSSGTGRGTVTLTGSPGGLLTTFAFYLTGGGNPAMLVNLDENSTMSGTVLPQAPGPFSAESFKGAYALNFDQGFLLSESDATGVASADGIGSLAGTADVNSIFFDDFGDVNFSPAPQQMLTGTFAASANGRFTGTLGANGIFPGPTINVAFYMVDSTRLLFVETDSAAVTLGLLELQSQPLP